MQKLHRANKSYLNFAYCSTYNPSTILISLVPLMTCVKVDVANRLFSMAGHCFFSGLLNAFERFQTNLQRLCRCSQQASSREWLLSALLSCLMHTLTASWVHFLCRKAQYAPRGPCPESGNLERKILTECDVRIFFPPETLAVCKSYIHL